MGTFRPFLPTLWEHFVLFFPRYGNISSFSSHAMGTFRHFLPTLWEHFVLFFPHTHHTFLYKKCHHICSQIYSRVQRVATPKGFAMSYIKEYIENTDNIEMLSSFLFVLSAAASLALCVRCCFACAMCPLLLRLRYVFVLGIERLCL